MTLRGIRGATTVSKNDKTLILSETKHLIQRMIETNAIHQDDIASIFFSVTHDLDAAFPAQAARELDLTYTPLLCLNEIQIPDSLKQCVRILMHVNTNRPQIEMKHIYLNDATILRPEFAQ